MIVLTSWFLEPLRYLSHSCIWPLHSQTICQFYFFFYQQCHLQMMLMQGFYPPLAVRSLFSLMAQTRQHRPPIQTALNYGSTPWNPTEPHNPDKQLIRPTLCYSLILRNCYYQSSPRPSGQT